MTTTCEEKPTVEFSLVKLVDQSSVSIGVLMFVMVFITVTYMVEWEFNRVRENLPSARLVCLPSWTVEDLHFVTE